MNVGAAILVFILGAEVAPSPERQLLIDVHALACGAELPCYKRKTLMLEDGLDLAAERIAGLGAELGFAEKTSALWREKALDALNAVAAIKPTIMAGPTLEPWHRSPVLWFTLGFVTAVGLALGIFALAKRVDATAGL